MEMQSVMEYGIECGRAGMRIGTAESVYEDFVIEQAEARPSAEVS